MQKYLRLVLILVPILALCVRLAADDDDDTSNPEDRIPDFSNLDQFVYQPKSTATVGFRYIGGVKTSFGGNSYIAAPEAYNPIPSSGSGFVRTYHDGVVAPDTRTETVTNANGIVAQVPITPDGKTNSWSYDTSGQLNAQGTATTSQITADDFMQFHIYSAQEVDPNIYDHNAKGTTGVEIRTDRDMGRLGKHWSWSIFAGASLNDIQSSMTAYVPANITTRTDTYNLYGETPAPGPQTYPATTQQNLISGGQDIIDPLSGSNITQNIDTGVLISAQPLSSSVVTAENSQTAFNSFKVHGAYLALRAGPSLSYNFGDHFKLSISAGPELLDASSTYTVNAVLVPNTGSEQIATFQDIENKFLPAAYVDATLQYDINDRAGLYFGAFYQESGSYKQSVSGYAVGTVESYGTYTTKVDFGSQDGLRTGLSFRF